jgi:DNA-binding CsgD family transcriptional regulator
MGATLVDFVIREVTESDLDACIIILTERFLYGPEQLKSLRRMWFEIVQQSRNVSALVTDVRTSRVLYFFITAFVTDERAASYHSLTRPKIALAMAEELRDGSRPFLDTDAIARANAGEGLNIVVLNYGVAPELYEAGNEELLEQIRAVSYECWRRNLLGWNLRTFTNEVFSVFQRDGKEMGEALGFIPRRYTDEQLDEVGIPREKQPWLWIATRDKVLEQEAGMSTATMFLSFVPPKLRLSLAEQEILRLALEGHTDELIAARTAASVSTIKKRFRTIYAKAKDAEIDSDAAQNGAEPDGNRGSETRRHLLNYLRDHPAELRPYRRVR